MANCAFTDTILGGVTSILSIVTFFTSDLLSYLSLTIIDTTLFLSTLYDSLACQVFPPSKLYALECNPDCESEACIVSVTGLLVHVVGIPSIYGATLGGVTSLMLLTVTVIELVCPPSIAFTFTSYVAFQLNVFVKIVCVVLTVPYVTGYDSLYDTFHPLALA